MFGIGLNLKKSQGTLAKFLGPWTAGLRPGRPGQIALQSVVVGLRTGQGKYFNADASMS